MHVSCVSIIWEILECREPNEKVLVEHSGIFLGSGAVWKVYPFLEANASLF